MTSLSKYNQFNYYKIMGDNYVVVQWPESQELMGLDDFKDNSFLINDEKGIDIYGSSAYFVNADWYNAVLNND